MPRNGSGVYSLPEPAFIPQTPISSSAVNNDLSDIATALTGSLPRNGEAGMTSTLPLSANGLNYVIDPDTGMRRSAANEQMIFCGGTDVVKITTEGLFDGVSGASLGFAVGVPYIWPFATAPTGCVFLYNQPCTSSYPIIRALLLAAGSPYGNNGTDPLFPDYRGAVPVGKSNMGGVDKGNLTGGTVLGAILGAQSVALTAAQNGPHTHTGSGTTAAENQGHTHAGAGTTTTESNTHTHTYSGTTGIESANHDHGVTLNQRQMADGAQSVVYSPTNPVGSATITSGNQSVNHTHNYSGTTGSQDPNHTHNYSFTTGGVSVNHTHTYSFTTASSGSGDAHPNVQPSIVQNFIMRVA